MPPEEHSVSRHSNPENLCTVCFCKEPNTVFMPCGHGGICDGCALGIFEKSDQCPFCRKEIIQVLEINDKFSRGLKKVVTAWEAEFVSEDEASSFDLPQPSNREESSVNPRQMGDEPTLAPAEGIGFRRSDHPLPSGPFREDSISSQPANPDPTRPEAISLAEPSQVSRPSQPSGRDSQNI